MKIAIVGSGVSGLAAARELSARCEVTVFEAAGHVGGHTHTHDVEVGGRLLRVDTGFIVFNRRTYPGFSALLDRLGVEAQSTEMSFSVHCEATSLEYNGRSLNSLFAQRSNLARPSFYRLIRDILRFNRRALEWLKSTSADDAKTLGTFLEESALEGPVVSHYVLPMGAAIWSAPTHRMSDFPARYFLRFFENHGLLSIADRPQWYVVRGGSHRYVERMLLPFRESLRLNSPVREIHRRPGGVELLVEGQGRHRFDAVVVATHADQALRMLADAEADEREILRALPYQENEVVLHTDASLLPRRKRAWASWNYHVPARASERVSVTYYMNLLQGLPCEEAVCVTLNRSGDIDPARILRRLTYHHPVLDGRSLRAQKRFHEISGRGGVHYCGAYWGFGFHEDGYRSGQRAAAAVIERREAA